MQDSLEDVVTGFQPPQLWLSAKRCSATAAEPTHFYRSATKAQLAVDRKLLSQGDASWEPIIQSSHLSWS